MEFKHSQIWLLAAFVAVIAFSGFVAPGSALELVVTPSRLPIPRHSHSAVYDGDDSIYVIGGTAVSEGISHGDKVLKYSIGSGAVEQVGIFQNLTYGAAVLHGEDILHFGGFLNHQGLMSDVFRYSLRSGSYVSANNFPIRPDFQSAVWDTRDQVAYVFGASLSASTQSDAVYKYDASSDEVTLVATLPTPRYATAAVWDEQRRLAYVFGGVGAADASREVLFFDPETNNVTKLSTELPVGLFRPSAAFQIGRRLPIGDEGKAYIIDNTPDGPLVFDPSTGTSETVAVDGWVGLYSAASVYVSKLDRIYILGGYKVLEGWTPTDEISYIALSG